MSPPALLRQPRPPRSLRRSFRVHQLTFGPWMGWSWMLLQRGPNSFPLGQGLQGPFSVLLCLSYRDCSEQSVLGLFPLCAEEPVYDTGEPVCYSGEGAESLPPPLPELSEQGEVQDLGSIGWPGRGLLLPLPGRDKLREFCFCLCGVYATLPPLCYGAAACTQRPAAEVAEERPWCDQRVPLIPRGTWGFASSLGGQIWSRLPTICAAKQESSGIKQPSWAASGHAPLNLLFYFNLKQPKFTYHFQFSLENKSWTPNFFFCNFDMRPIVLY